MEKVNVKKECLLIRALSREDWIGYFSASLITSGGIVLMIYIALL